MSKAIDVGYVIARLEEASTTLSLFPADDYSTRLAANELYKLYPAFRDGWRPARRWTPTSDEIGRMEEASAWLSLIPGGPLHMRRLVAKRSMLDRNGRHIHSWRTLAKSIGEHHPESARRAHALGIRIIVAKLNLTPELHKADTRTVRPAPAKARVGRPSREMLTGPAYV